MYIIIILQINNFSVLSLSPNAIKLIGSIIFNVYLL